MPHHTPASPPDPFRLMRDRLLGAYTETGVVVPYRPGRHDPGDVLEYDLRGVANGWEGRATLEVERFVGGGFAGQVYRVRLLGFTPTAALSADVPPGLVIGGRYALKLLRPPGAGALWFRNLLYALGYQAPFAPQANHAAVRAGALWQKVVRRAALLWFGDERAVCDTYATLYDESLHTFGVLNEWVDGRVWKFEIDDRLFERWKFTGEVPSDHPCPEYVGKRLFMRRMVELLHRVGAAELARQYEWWTCKSQPNVLLRADPDGSGRLTALDFSAGLVLLPVLPMSPADVVLILRGIVRGRFVQFDRGDLARLEAFVAQHDSLFEDLRLALEELVEQEATYRQSLPDVTHHGLRVLIDRRLRRSIRAGIVKAWRNLGYVDEAHAARALARPGLFRMLYAASALPFLGPILLRLWGTPLFRDHVRRCLTSPSYLVRALRADRASILVGWARTGRASPARAMRLLDRAIPFTLERLALSWLPVSWHRGLTEPSWAWALLREKIARAVRFLRDPAYREDRLLGEVAEGLHEGMLTEAEAAKVTAQIKDPYIQKYLRCLAVHVCTLPITQVVMLIVGVAVTLFCAMSRGMSWAEATALGTAAAATIQVLPISPGSITRGLFVVYLMIRERDIKNYYIAAPISFIHVLGYLAFPFQMVAHDPALARFLAGRWTRRIVNHIPVFGEHGALLEHAVFDLCFNLPLSIARLLRRRRRRTLGGGEALPLP